VGWGEFCVYHHCSASNTTFSFIHTLTYQYAILAGYLLFKEEAMIDKDLLEKFPLFSDTPQENLSEITQLGKIVEFDLNQTIFQEGSKAFDLYGVVDGEVELSITVRDKIIRSDIQYEESIQTSIVTIENDIIVESIEANEIFGWSAFVSPRLYTTTAKCSKPARIISLPADELKSIFVKNPQLGYVFMERMAQIISQRLRNRTDKLIESWSQAFKVNRI
jgi:CRP-like cAMP-binding protein